MWIREFHTRRGLRHLHLDTSPELLREFADHCCEVNSGSATVIQVGDVQCIIENEIVTTIQILFWRGTPNIPDGSFDEECNWHRDVPIDEILGMIEESGLVWAVDQRLTFDRQLAILVEKSVRVMIDLDRKELQSVSITSGK